jgi:hypothetical protein
MASPRIVVRVVRASRAVRREYPRATICISHTLISCAVSDISARSPNVGKMWTSIA